MTLKQTRSALILDRHILLAVHLCYSYLGVHGFIDLSISILEMVEGMGDHKDRRQSSSLFIFSPNAFCAWF